jgi:DNA-binding transcriptional LysR family regulator
VVLSDPESCALAAEEGLGIAAMSVDHMWPSMRGGKLRIILLDPFVSPPPQVVLQYPRHALTGSRVKVFVEHVVAQLQNHPDLQYGSAELTCFQAKAD